MESEELVNIDGTQQCLVCGVSFRVYSDDQNSINYCPSCGAVSSKFIARPDLEE